MVGFRVSGSEDWGLRVHYRHRHLLLRARATAAPGRSAARDRARGGPMCRRLRARGRGVHPDLPDAMTAVAKPAEQVIALQMRGVAAPALHSAAAPVAAGVN